MAYRWHLDSSGYAFRSIYPGKQSVRLHRWLLGLDIGDPLQVDHINGDRLDCRRANMRIVTAAQNAQNRTSHRGSSSRYRGVSFLRSRDRWYAYVTQRRRIVWSAYFASEEEAAAAAAAKRAELMPFAVPGR